MNLTFVLNSTLYFFSLFLNEVKIGWMDHDIRLSNHIMGMAPLCVGVGGGMKIGH